VFVCVGGLVRHLSPVGATVVAALLVAGAFFNVLALADDGRFAGLLIAHSRLEGGLKKQRKMLEILDDPP
jgi:hypothetical protein